MSARKRLSEQRGKEINREEKEAHPKAKTGNGQFLIEQAGQGSKMNSKLTKLFTLKKER